MHWFLLRVPTGSSYTFHTSRTSSKPARQRDANFVDRKSRTHSGKSTSCVVIVMAAGSNGHIDEELVCAAANANLIMQQRSPLQNVESAQA